MEYILDLIPTVSYLSSTINYRFDLETSDGTVEEFTRLLGQHKTPFCVESLGMGREDSRQVEGQEVSVHTVTETGVSTDTGNFRKELCLYT